MRATSRRGAAAKPVLACGGLCLAALVLLLVRAPTAGAAFDDPLFVLRPLQPPPPPPPPPGFKPPPPVPFPANGFEGACGIAVDNAGNVYVSDYYHDTIDIFGPDIRPYREKDRVSRAQYDFGNVTHLSNIDPVDGPCAVAVDATGNIYVNDFHRALIKYPPLSVWAPPPAPYFPTEPAGTAVVPPTLDESGPTGVAVDPVAERLYVNERDRVAVFTLAGVPLGQIGASSLEDAYSLAVSRFPATAGRVYVPDAATDTVKVYEPKLGATIPVQTINGAGTPLGHFTSLEDSAVAIDNVTGEVYVADNLNPAYTEQPETVIWVFDSMGAYKGRLKYSVVFGQPNGLAVDNSGTANQSRVYVTGGNTEKAAVYVYPPHAVTSSADPLPEPFIEYPPSEPGAFGAGATAIGEKTPLVSAPTAAPLAPAVAAGTPAASPRRRPPGTLRNHRYRAAHTRGDRHHQSPRRARR